MKKVKNRIFYLFLAIILTVGFSLWLGGHRGLLSSNGFVMTAWADDDEEDEDDDEEEDEDEYRSTSTSSSSSSGNTSVKTNVDTQITVFKDSDGDGLLNKDDPHPDMAEIYIVKDDNRNGIVDSFE